MALRDIALRIPEREIGGALDVFLREAEDRIADYQASRKAAATPLFVPCDFVAVYSVLLALRKWQPLPNRRFCEWGSGFGVATCLAAMLGFTACGVEIEPDLVDQAGRLALDFGLSAEFYCGSFIPDGFDARPAVTPRDAMKTPALSREKKQRAATYVEMGLDMKDFGLIFGYPWPDEEPMIERLFEAVAAPDAILVTYRGIEDLRIQKKASPRLPRA